ncbi:OadG family protein [Marinilabiliaceae bacterium ANBcel2]|nr:OadG family protein [Marinilabiliaceae bacterium ANBcel2]
MNFLIDLANWDWSDIFVITAVGYSVVFAVLILLIIVYKLMPKVLNLQLKRRLKKEGREITAKSDEEYVPGEVNAAVATALHLYFNQQHDEESNIITIKRVERTYSPWSSKIYNMNNARHYQP